MKKNRLTEILKQLTELRDEIAKEADTAFLHSAIGALNAARDNIGGHLNAKPKEPSE